MNPQAKSILTSILMTAAGGLGSVAVAYGIIPSQDAGSFANILVSVLLAAVTGLLAWYKARQLTPTAAIQQVNSQDNGVKVVAASSPSIVVTEPLKGAK